MGKIATFAGVLIYIIQFKPHLTKTQCREKLEEEKNKQACEN